MYYYNNNIKQLKYYVTVITHSTVKEKAMLALNGPS